LIKLNILNSKTFGRQLKQVSVLLLGWGMLWGSAIAKPLSADIQPPQEGVQRVSDWRALIADSSELSDREKLQRVNEFFNRTIRYGEDIDVWQQADYWASPMETLEKGRGDCEDFALAKYFTLRLLGVPERSLRVVYATQTSTQQAHMVLGYWQNADADPLLLDNLGNDIRSSAQRSDLNVKFAFDETGLYAFDHARFKPVGNVGQLPDWLPLVKRAKREESDLMNRDEDSISSGLMLSAARSAYKRY
jgi:predicted transglutaminase-like cysteine proteinase